MGNPLPRLLSRAIRHLAFSRPTSYYVPPYICVTTSIFKFFVPLSVSVEIQRCCSHPPQHPPFTIPTLDTPPSANPANPHTATAGESTEVREPYTRHAHSTTEEAEFLRVRVPEHNPSICLNDFGLGDWRASPTTRQTSRLCCGFVGFAYFVSLPGFWCKCHCSCIGHRPFVKYMMQSYRCAIADQKSLRVDTGTAQECHISFAPSGPVHRVVHPRVLPPLRQFCAVYHRVRCARLPPEHR